MNADTIQRLFSSKITTKKSKPATAVLDEIETKYLELLNEIKNFTSSNRDVTEIARNVRNEVETILQLEDLNKSFSSSRSRNLKKALVFLKESLSENLFHCTILIGWTLVRYLGRIFTDEDYEAQSRSWIDEWLLGKMINPVFHDLGFDETQSWQALALIKILTSHQNWFQINKNKKGLGYRILKRFLEDQEVQQFLQVNRYQDVLWFNKEAFETLIGWLFEIAFIDITKNKTLSQKELVSTITVKFEIIKIWQKAEEQSNYQVEKLIEELKMIG